MNAIPTKQKKGRKDLSMQDAYKGVSVALQRDVKRKTAILREALEAMTNLAPRVKDYGGCFGRMAGGYGGENCLCTACKIRREIGPANSR